MKNTITLDNNTYYRKELNVQKNAVVVDGYTFNRHQYAYKQRMTLDKYTKLYVELHQSATVDCIRDTISKFKDNKVVVSTADRVDKASQFHNPLGYIIIGNTLTDAIIFRAQEVLRFGHKVRIITDNHNVLYKSEYSLQSELDDVYYALDGNKANRVKQSPFLCELQGTYNERGAQLLQAYRAQHYTFVFNYVYELTQELYQLKSEDIREARYERVASTVYYSNYYYDQYLKHPKAPVLKARLSLKAKAYGFNLRFDESVPTIDKYQPAEYIFPKKVSPTAESSETIWDTNSVDKALVTVRQKQKIAELPSSNREIYETIEALKWMETHEDMYLDLEDTYKCSCGYPASIRDYRCIVCDTVNPNYDTDLTTENAAELDMRIEEMRNEEVTTYYLEGQKHF